MSLRATLGLLVCTTFAVAGPKPSPEAIEHFEKYVRPILVERCVECHGPKKQSADLRLDSKSRLTQGGENGPVVVPGDPDKSPLIQAIRHAGELKMPPKEKLTPEAIETLTSWVKAGAVFPDDPLAASDNSKSHWAFQPVRPVALPKTKRLVAHPVDRFIQAKLEANGLSLAVAAERRTLIRRLSYDLIGLLPTPDEVDALADSS